VVEVKIWMCSDEVGEGREEEARMEGQRGWDGDSAQTNPGCFYATFSSTTPPFYILPTPF
jgi:hypothetical protein